MKEIQWIVSDLDGTLLNNQKQISQKNQKAIQWLFEQGIDFGIVSGRPVKTIYETLDFWQIKPYVRFIIGRTELLLWIFQRKKSPMLLPYRWM